MAFECPRRSSPPSPMFDADTGCIATDPAPSARRRFRSKTGIENLPANEHAQETPHTPSPTRTTRRIQSGCAGSRPRLRDGMPGSPSQHIDITRAKWIPYLSYFRHKTVPRRSPSPSIVTRPPRDAPVGPGGACCRRGSLTRSAPSPAPARHYVPASRPMSLLWAPKTCSTRTRTDERVLLPCFSRSLSGLLRRPLRWIRLRNPFSFSAASISAER